MNDTKQRDVFARNLQDYMKKRGVEQVDIVTKLEITASTVSDWCKGKKYPRVDAMQKLADFLGCRISDLTSEEPAQNPPLPSDEDERELLLIFRKLDRRAKHEMMAKAYELEKSISTRRNR